MIQLGTAQTFKNTDFLSNSFDIGLNKDPLAKASITSTSSSSKASSSNAFKVNLTNSYNEKFKFTLN